MSKRALRKTLKELTEEAEKGSFWLWKAGILGPVTGLAGRCLHETQMKGGFQMILQTGSLALSDVWHMGEAIA